MATLTTSQFLDEGAARTAGETFALNGAVLTIRTDTRVHSNAPAGMLGSVGSMTISTTLGGGVFIDATAVRWMPFDSGSGTVPAIGTTIVQGGVEGYILGVWTDIDTAPTPPGDAMPVSGFIKFREVVGGAFSVGALSGISANATSTDRVGWIEVVQDQLAANKVPRLGSFKTRGDWFYLDDTNGSAHQAIKTPNMGGVGARIPCIWVETGVGTGEYDRYVCVSATYFTTVNLGTDARCKYALMGNNGVAVLGGDGVNLIGYLPPAGCKVRIPNIIGRQTSVVNRSFNLVPHTTPASRPDFNTLAAGDIDFEFFINDWYHLFSSAFKVRIINSATIDVHSSSNLASPILLDNYATGVYLSAGGLSLSFMPLGGIIKDSKFMRGDAPSNGNTITVSSCGGLDFQGTFETGAIAYARSSGVVSFSQSYNITQSGKFIAYCVSFNPSICRDFVFEEVEYVDRLVGVTNATTGKYAITLSNACDSIVINGVSFGDTPNVYPYLGVITSSNSSRCKIRNGGTKAVPLSAPSIAYIFADAGNNDDISIQNIHVTDTRTSLYASLNTSKNLKFENLSGTNGSVATASVNTIARGLRATSNSTSGQAACYGTHWFDMFTSATAGLIWLAFNEPTAFSADQFEAVQLGAGAGFTSSGNLVMPNIGDEVIFTMPYFVRGHTATTGVPVLTGVSTGNFGVTFDIDNGTGFSGVYKTLDSTQWGLSTVNPDGFRLRFRVVTNTAGVGSLTYIRVSTVSTALAQQFNYPFDTINITLSNLVSGTRVQIYNLDTSQEIFNGVVGSTTLTVSTEFISDFNCRFRLMHNSGVSATMWMEFSEVITIEGLTRKIVQVADAIYSANAIDGSAVTGIIINDSSLLVEIDDGMLSWADIYAYETYWLSTEEGIRDEDRFMVAVDQANYKLYQFKIKNVSSPSTPLVISGGYAYDGGTGYAIDLLDTSGGTIFTSPDRVVPFAISGGVPVTPAQLVAAIKPDLTIINNGVKKASKLIPHGDNLT